MSMIQPSDVQRNWMDLQYGMFIHFGLTTFEGVECGSGSFDPIHFNPTELNIAQWAKIAAEAGMKYAVLTAKHVDGFCLWPSKFTEYSVKNAKVNVDIVGEFVKEFRKAGLKVGLYYALWDCNYPDYENDAAYARYMRNQVEELLTNYGEIIEIWFDGGWDKEHPTKEWLYDANWERDPNSGLKHGEVWDWAQLYELVHKLQPNCLVANNASSDRPGGIRYFPVDLRIAERCDYIIDGKVYKAIADPVFEHNGEKVFLPMEYCNTLNPNWFHIEGQHILHPSVDTICGWYKTARESNSNLLLNVGPDKRGLLPEFHIDYLMQAAERLGLR